MIWTPNLAAPQLDQIAKTRQKWNFKNSWNWLIMLVSATIRQVLNVKLRQPKMKVIQICRLVKALWGTYFRRVIVICNHCASPPPGPQWETNCKNPPKIKIWKIVKLTDYNNAYNSLTNCEYKVNELIGNGNYVNLLKLAGKNSWNHFSLTYFWRI